VRLLSVNVGQRRPNPWKGISATGIDKQPAVGRVSVVAPGPKGTGALVFRAVTLEPELLPRLLVADALPAEIRELARKRSR
jgi:hypothetical protein